MGRIDNYMGVVYRGVFESTEYGSMRFLARVKFYNVIIYDNSSLVGEETFNSTMV